VKISIPLRFGDEECWESRNLERRKFAGNCASWREIELTSHRRHRSRLEDDRHHTGRHFSRPRAQTVDLRFPIVIRPGGRIFVTADGLGSLEYWANFYVRSNSPLCFSKFEAGRWQPVGQ
jgi:hypothetical protein